MPYTLTKGLLWFALALLLGVVIGWLLRSIRATRQIRAARASRHEPAELERLKARIANLEPSVAEVERLKADLAVARHTATSASAEVAPVPRAEPDPVEPDSVAVIEPPAVAATPEDSSDTPAATPSATLAATPSATPSESPAATGRDVAGDAVATGDAVDADLAEAATVLGKRVVRDDLTVIEGIGPQIAALANGIGVHTWNDLAETEVSLLRTMLADAGPSFATHVPDSWPTQAGLLAEGRWAEFKALVDRLDGGKLPD